MPRWVTPCFAIASSNFGGPPCSIVALAAPKRSGNIGVMPSPKVKAIGALVRKTSPGFGPIEMLRERVARREDVAVELDAALGHAGRAAGEGDERTGRRGRCRRAAAAASEAVRVSSSPFP